MVHRLPTHMKPLLLILLIKQKVNSLLNLVVIEKCIRNIGLCDLIVVLRVRIKKEFLIAVTIELDINLLLLAR